MPSEGTLTLILEGNILTYLDSSQADLFET